jgi:hypothetical protein
MVTYKVDFIDLFGGALLINQKTKEQRKITVNTKTIMESVKVLH